MKFSTYNWGDKPGLDHEYGWIIGPFFGRTVSIRVRRQRSVEERLLVAENAVSRRSA